MANQTHLFGVRHHGPGSARAVLRALQTVRPQCVLVEGPPDANAVVEWAANEGMQPPVALLVYRADDAKNAAFYPFAKFSPEWCAIQWSLNNGVPVRFMDLPQSHRMAIDPAQERNSDAAEANKEADQNQPTTATAAMPGEVSQQPADLPVRLDPLSALARAAGFDDGERWWEHTFEHRRHSDMEVFTAIGEAMEALRESSVTSQPSRYFDDRVEPLREAWMRRTLRETQKVFDNVVAVCGAWHVPALSEDVVKSRKKEDDATLKSLAKVKTIATWIPWTYDRLAASSGYGAGVLSPGWYEHLWQTESLVLERWMALVGRLLREQDLDCSCAHVIEATRLATSLAAMRGRPLADLSDIDDACRAVFCFDSDTAMRLIARKLLVGERLGEVPESIPLAPLQQDLQSQQKSLRLKPEALEKTLDLDLRNETDLHRSELLHRLRLMGIDWGVPQESRSGKGTFHELWRLRWEPAYLVKLIELGAWGSTIESAAAGYACQLADNALDLPPLTLLLGDVLLANLPTVVQRLMDRILTTAAVSSDVAKLMDAFPPLAEAFRYGNVRQTDKALVRRAIDGVLPRIIVGLGGAVASLNDQAAREMEQRIVRVHQAVELLDSSAESDEWMTCLLRITDQGTVHGMVRGRCARLLFDHGKLTGDEVATRLSLMLSRGGNPDQAAAWVEGFLSSSGLILLHHDELLSLIDQWICSISTDVFNEQVPLLRRTFASFAPAERRQIGERLRAGRATTPSRETNDNEWNPARAARVLPVLQTIFGVESQDGKS
jgi:hypothetical protein